ncbi:pseudouridine synthase [Clostridia bacterium]|nr:pseudouridine synthase [Clostridia bacterium]
MLRLEAGVNEDGRRLDRYLKKILPSAPLAFIYRTLRKDVKVNGRHAAQDTLLKDGDVIEIFLAEGQLSEFGGRPRTLHKAKRQFGIVYEDDNVLFVNKPFGLLTHGDEREKKNTLANQVAGYLAEQGTWRPEPGNTFSPASANRLDRNTTGLVAFGKTLPALRDLAAMMRGKADAGEALIEKYYLTIVRGRPPALLTLTGQMIRDRERNVSRVLPVGIIEEDESADAVQIARMEARPIWCGRAYTLVEARLITGRTHQIRAQLAAAGYPVIGDRKYGDARVNEETERRFGLTTQLLHAHRLILREGTGSLAYLSGREFTAEPPERFRLIGEGLGCYTKTK